MSNKLEPAVVSNSEIAKSTAMNQSSKMTIPKIKMSRFTDFMKNHFINKENSESPTNTRIGNKSAGIFGGSYYISEDEYSEFLNLYYEEVFVQKKQEYLTEKQLDKEGPILIDIDLNFALDLPGRVYTDDHINDLLNNYLGNLKNIYQFDEDVTFPIYVFEKSNVKRVPEKNKTKDGIHIIIGIKSDRITQQILRKRMVTEIKDMWEGEFDITNTWDDVLDNCISSGSSNWQMYGSTKPTFEPYVLSKVYNVVYNSDDNDLDLKTVPLNKFDLKRNFEKLSARYKNHPMFFYKTEFIKIRQDAIDSGQFTTNSSEKKARHENTPVSMNAVQSTNLFNVQTRAELQDLVNQFLDNIVKGSLEYELKETYEYTMTLPVSYYGSGSFLKWIRVGWALRNISDKLFIVWVAFSAQSSEFDFTSIMDLYDKWVKFDMNNPNGLTKRSIMHWSKIDAREKYRQVRENSIDYYIDQTLNIDASDLDSDKKITKGCGDFDLAVVLYHLYKDEYVCVSVKANIWYTYKKHRWEEIDSGTTLRKAISMELRDMYRRRISQIMDAQSSTLDEKTARILQLKSNKILDVCLRLGKTNDKKNIMTEAKELFYDGSFLQKLDVNPYLLCFNNGVIDFKEKIFRRGYPEDHISKTTNIDYIPINPERDRKAIDEIQDFMRKLFPIPELHDYMWEHLASTLIGVSPNQTFNMYIGVGQNGKSVLVSLMEKILGEYKGDVPLSLVTDKRQKIGGLAPEIVQLKGIRYAVMNEPSKGDRINEGVMKQLTSGVDPIQGRAPYMPQTISFIPQFKLVVCSNEFMEIKSQDHGTWRRIRIVDFLSKFVEKPIVGDKTCPYQYKIDSSIIEKFCYWKEPFAALLVAKAFETNGITRDCDVVMKASNSYRESQDCISEFISDKILVDEAGTITKTELTSEFTIWYQGTYGKGGPNIKDVQAYMDKRFGKFEKYKCWKGVRINYDRDVMQGGNCDDNNSENTDICDIVLDEL